MVDNDVQVIGYTECVICIQDISYRDKTKVLSCGHMFHQLCILPWMLNNSICPLCRYKSSESKFSILSEYKYELYKKKNHYATLERYTGMKIVYCSIRSKLSYTKECRHIYKNRLLLYTKTKDNISYIKMKIQKELNSLKRHCNDYSDLR